MEIVPNKALSLSLSLSLPAAACTFESGHLTLVSGAGEGEVVSKKVGKEVRGAQG